MLSAILAMGTGIFLFGITVTSVFAKAIVMMEEEEQKRR